MGSMNDGWQDGEQKVTKYIKTTENTPQKNNSKYSLWREEYAAPFLYIDSNQFGKKKALEMQKENGRFEPNEIPRKSKRLWHVWFWEANEDERKFGGWNGPLRRNLTIYSENNNPMITVHGGSFYVVI